MPAGPLPGDVDQPVHHRHPTWVAQALPIAVDIFGLAWAHQIGAVIVVDKEEPILAIDHRRQHLGDLPLGFVVVRGCRPIDMGKGIARLSDIVAQLCFLGFQKLALKDLDFLFGHGARLIGHQSRNRAAGDNHWQSGQKRQFLSVVRPENLADQRHG